MRILAVLLVVLVVVLYAAPVGTEPLPDDAPAGPAAIDGGSDEPAGGNELEEFVPSEEVSADRAISFPVDI